MLVTATGGPFVSPFSELMIAAFFLGMIRADSQKSIRFLLLFASLCVVSSLVIVENDAQNIHFNGWWYLPAAVVVGWATYAVNIVNFEEKLFFRTQASNVGPLPPSGTPPPAGPTAPAP